MKEIKWVCWSVDPSGFYGWYQICSHLLAKVAARTPRLILLNAMVPYDGLTFTTKIDMDTARELVKYIKENNIDIISFIGHESTARLISEKIGVNVEVNRGMYEPKMGDVFMIFRLRKRLAKPEDIKEVRDEDIEVWVGTYLMP